MPADRLAGNGSWGHVKGLPPMAGGLVRRRGEMALACVQPYWALRL